ncbi:hypothetical protein OG21DRAFT_1518487, partial [Imleria badia]
MALERSSAAAYNSHLNSYLTFYSVVVYLAGICNCLESEFPDVRQHRTHPLTALHDDLLFATLVATGFYVLMCLGELVWPDTVALQSFRKVILRFSLRIDHNSYSFTLPTHKSLK